MEGFIEQSQAHTFQFGPFMDEDDGKTEETSLTIAYTDVFLSKNGGAAGAKNDTTNLTGTGDARGYYDCVLNATDTNTLGTLKVMCGISGALPVWATFMVLPTNVYDSLVGGTDNLQVDTTQVGGTSQTANDMSGDIDTILSRIIGTLASGTHEPQTGDSYAIVNNGTYGNAQLVRSTTPANTLDINATGEAGIDLDNTSGTLAKTTDITGFNDPSTADIADGVWDEVIETDHETDQTAGEHLNALAKNILARTNTQDLNGLLGVADSAGTDLPEQVWSETTRVLTANTNLNDPTAAAIVDEWETQSQADPTTFQVNVMEVNGTAQTANDNGADINAILDDTGTNGVVIVDGGITSAKFAANAIQAAAINADALTAAKFATDSITSDALATSAADKVFDSTGSITSISFETLIERIYEMINNKMTVNESSGAVALRDIGDSNDVATGNVASSSGTTTRAELSWV